MRIQGTDRVRQGMRGARQHIISGLMIQGLEQGGPLPCQVIDVVRIRHDDVHVSNGPPQGLAQKGIDRLIKIDVYSYKIGAP